MNWAHIHLLLNHVPVLGTIFGLALLAWAMFRRNDAVKKAALGAFTVAALIALPAYFTGEPAEGAVEGVAGVTDQVIDTHEEAALVSLIGIELLGVIALGGLYVSRGGRPMPRTLTGAALVVSLLTGGLMARAANLGGQIRHPEIRAGAQPPVAAEHEADDGR